MYSISRTIYSALVTMIKKETKCESEKAMEVADKFCAMIEEDVKNATPKISEIQYPVILPSLETIPQEVTVTPIDSTVESPAQKKARIDRMVKAGMGQVDRAGNFTPTGRQVSFDTVTGSK